MGYISKDRDHEAVILEAPIGSNISMASLPDLQKHSLIRPSRVKKLVDAQMEQLSIKARSRNQWVNTLSGGKKQKVSFAKWMAKGSDVVIMDCPTRGVDVGVKQAMYALINTDEAGGQGDFNDLRGNGGAHWHGGPAPGTQGLSGGKGIHPQPRPERDRHY